MENKTGNKKKILFIEDEKMLAEMYFDKFTKEGFQVLVAFEVKEGLALAEKEKPDLIILDILLPRENGIAFLGYQKKNRKISEIPVIVFSNFDAPEIKKQAFQLGAKDYLIKTNYTPSRAVETIKKFFEDRENQNEKSFK